MIQTGKMKSFDGTNLYYRVDGVNNPRAMVVIVHGLAEHHRRYDELTAFFNANEISVLRYDQRGHGLSEGTRGYLNKATDLFEDLHEVLHVARDLKVHPLIVLGHSMGGYTLTGYAMHYQNQVEGLIFSAPLTLDHAGISKGVDLSLDPMTLCPNTLGSLICKDQAVVAAYEADPLVLKETTISILQEIKKSLAMIEAGIPKIVDPLLIVHGDEDRIVSKEDSIYLFDHVSSEDSQLAIYPDMYHEVLNELEHQSVFEDILEWIRERLEDVDRTPPKL